MAFYGFSLASAPVTASALSLALLLSCVGDRHVYSNSIRADTSELNSALTSIYRSDPRFTIVTVCVFGVLLWRVLFGHIFLNNISIQQSKYSIKIKSVGDWQPRAPTERDSICDGAYTR